jgi:hypothetical protein
MLKWLRNGDGEGELAALANLAICMEFGKGR